MTLLPPLRGFCGPAANEVCWATNEDRLSHAMRELSVAFPDAYRPCIPQLSHLDSKQPIKDKSAAGTGGHHHDWHGKAIFVIQVPRIAVPGHFDTAISVTMKSSDVHRLAPVWIECSTEQ